MANALTSIAKPLINSLNKLSGWLLLLAIIWLCWGIARIVWLLLAPPQAPNLPVLPIQTPQVERVDARRALAIFEEPTPQTQQAQPPPNMILTGVMTSSKRSLSSALLSVNGQIANYRVGEQLTGTNYTLVDVKWDSVLVEDNRGRQSIIKMPERMSLDQGSQPGALNNATNAANNAANAANNRLPQAQANNTLDAASRNIRQPRRRLGVNQSVDPNNAQSSDTPAQNLDTAINELRQNPAGYLSNMGVMATGEGYQVTKAMPENLRKKIGLEPGDRVMSVNGQPVGNNPASDADLLNEVKQSGQATIEIRRGDQTLTVRQNFN